MTDRDRLIELIQNAVNGCARHWAEIIADYLLANGVIVPPVQVGQKVWILYSIEKTIKCKEITGITRHKNSWTMTFISGECFTVWDNAEDEYFGKTVFLTKVEAEKALKEREGK